MPVAAKQEEGRVKEKIQESALKGIDPASPASKYRSDDIGYIISELTGNRLSSVLINDIFNLLYLPVPKLKEKYPELDKDYYATIAALLSELKSSDIRMRTVANVDASTVATVNIATNLIKSLEEMSNQEGQKEQKSKNGQGQLQSGQQNEQQHGDQPQHSQDEQNQQQGQGGQQQNQQGNQQSGQGGQLQQERLPFKLNGIGDQFDAARLLEKLIENGLSEKEAKELMNQLSSMAESIYEMGGRIQPPSGKVPKEAAKEAVDKTGESNESMDELKARAHGAGKGAGVLQFNNSDPLAVYLSKRTDIRNLLKILSGIPDSASASRDKSNFSRGEYDGYGFGKDFTSLAPSVFAYPPELIYALYAHRRLPKYDKIVRENEKTRYVLFDKSGSMNNERMLFAKVVAISLYLSAMEEKGDFYLTYFDDIVHQKIEVLKNAKRDKKEAMVAFLDSASESGGTNIGLAILTACEDLAKDRSKKKKEIILITDGECLIDVESIKARLSAVKAELITIYINQNFSSQYVGILEKISKRLFLIEKVDKDNLLKLVSEMDRR